MAIDAREMNWRLMQFCEAGSSPIWGPDYESLSAPARVFRAVWELESEVNNGGFRLYFSSSSGSLASYAADALREIGAERMAEIVSRAVQVVGQNIEWTNDNVRRSMVNAIATHVEDRLDTLDQEFYAYPDNLTALLYLYVCQHRRELGAPDEF